MASAAGEERPLSPGLAEQLDAFRATVPAEQLRACNANLVLFDVGRTPYDRVTAQIMFPRDSDVASPSSSSSCGARPCVAVELKSRVLPDELVRRLQSRCAEQAANVAAATMDEGARDNARGCRVRRPVFESLRAVRALLLELVERNRFIACWDEVRRIRRHARCSVSRADEARGYMRLRLSFSDAHYLVVELTVPESYPAAPFDSLDIVAATGFSRRLVRLFESQARERARKRVVPPPRMPRAQMEREGFPKRYLHDVVVGFLMEECVERYPAEVCPVCHARVVGGGAAGRAHPSDTESGGAAAASDERPRRPAPPPPPPPPPNPQARAKQQRQRQQDGGKRVVRIYCSHLYHYQCLHKYLHEPPFPENGKPCLACGKRILHEEFKMAADMGLAEKRWAHEEARKREIGEVGEFLGLDDDEAAAAEAEECGDGDGGRHGKPR